VGRPGLEHLLGRLEVVEARVRALVAHRRADDPDPDDAFRGLYLSEAQVTRLLRLREPPPPDPAAAARLAEVEASADRAGAPTRLRELAGRFGLDPVDVELLLVALAPDLDPRFERFYGYLNDDVSRRRASIGLALELCLVPARSAAAHQRFGRGCPLVAGGLVVVEDPERPLLTRALRVPDRVTAHLLGHDRPDPQLAGVLVQLSEPGGASDGAGRGDHGGDHGAHRGDHGAHRDGGAGAGPGDRPGDDGDHQAGGGGLGRVLAGGTLLAYVRERPGASGAALGAAALAATGRPALILDLDRLDPALEVATVAAAAAREARLAGGGRVAGPVEALASIGAHAVRVFAELPVPVVLRGRCTWDPAWSLQVPALVDAAAAGGQAALWGAHLNGELPAGLDPGAVTAQFRLAPEQIARAATAARLAAATRGRPIGAEELLAGARAQNAAGLERLARRIEPRVGWADLVLPEPTVGLLRELVARVRRRDLVLDGWGLGRSAPGGRGTKALFAGDSGTGKTMSAEVVAGELGLDLYVVDLATVVDKYVGETEKNLDRIFAEADRVNGVLLFDEADALFGKRSEVRDAHDRYANVEVAYLLQRMELFEGLAVLTTNLRSNLDDAFARRLDSIVDYSMPEEADRRRLWDLNLAAGVPRGDDLDLAFLARAFKLSGGNIRNIVLTAAFLAADAGGPVGMAHLVRATEREYRKLGRLCVEAEFGPYFPLVARAAP
jgi:hypothetical protein